MRGPPIKEEPKPEIPPEQAIRKVCAPVKEIEKRLKRIIKIMDELLVSEDIIIS